MPSELGIDTQQVAYTRLEGTVAYRIGEKDPEKPKLLIEKARVLPLLIVYRRPDHAARGIGQGAFSELQEGGAGLGSF